MIRILVISAFIILFSSCNNRNKELELPVIEEKGEIIAEEIIYDVIVKPQSEYDEWETEKLEGYDGSSMIDRIFESIYDSSVEVFDYFTGEKLSPGDVRSMEKQDGFERNKIGKIQFTENWYFNSQNLQIEKEIISIVPGYESRSSDGTFIGYKAAFRLDLKMRLETE